MTARWSLAQLAVPATVLVIGWLNPPVPVSGPGPALTVTSILTGFTFSLALHFWKTSVDARRDSRYAFDSKALNRLDGMRARMTFAVVVGIASTGWLAGLWLWGVDPKLTSWPYVVAGSLMAYQLALVLIAVADFSKASVDLR